MEVRKKEKEGHDLDEEISIVRMRNERGSKEEKVRKKEKTKRKERKISRGNTEVQNNPKSGHE